MENDFGSSNKRFTTGISFNIERVSSRRFPDPLFIINMFRDDLDFRGGQESGIEPNTKLTNKIE
jgi:hypothetical protein